MWKKGQNRFGGLRDRELNLGHFKMPIRHARGDIMWIAGHNNVIQAEAKAVKHKCGYPHHTDGKDTG